MKRLLTFCYKKKVLNNLLSETMSFKAMIVGFLLMFLFLQNAEAQKNDANGPFYIIQITDPQFGMFEKNRSFEKETVLYEKAVVGVNQLNPDFVVITGDFVHDQNSELQMNEFKRITAEINRDIPVYYTPGNHDIGVNPTKKSIKEYQKNYGKDRFSFIYNNCLFIGFNSGLIKAGLPKAEALIKLSCFATIRFLITRWMNQKPIPILAPNCVKSI
ncbi:MAG: metallophosphoesterase [Bacteroidales bacterium]|nr:metallophosphoesterase [Bacteroidales bacterium]